MTAAFHLPFCHRPPHLQRMPDTTTRPCGICGAPVLYASSLSLGWHPIEYHDCKPVPGAWLEAAKPLLREGLDTGRHCCSDRADCPRCAWEEKVRSLLDPNPTLHLVGHIGPNPATEKRPWTLPSNATKRFLRPRIGGGWDESDDVNGPWTPLPVQVGP